MIIVTEEELVQKDKAAERSMRPSMACGVLMGSVASTCVIIAPWILLAALTREFGPETFVLQEVLTPLIAIMVAMLAWHAYITIFLLREVRARWAEKILSALGRPFERDTFEVSYILGALAGPMSIYCTILLATNLMR